MIRPFILLLELASLVCSQEEFLGLADGLDFNFTPSDIPQPFTINVDTDFLSTNRPKASLYRPTKPVPVTEWSDGPPTSDISSIQQYFLSNYSWIDVQAGLNNKYTQYTTTVSAAPNYTEPVYLHFAHQRSTRPDAIPLLMIHGFPSSFLEFESVIDSFASPPNSSLPAFHVVTPNLPGYAFSPPPTADGFGSRETGIAFNNLMHQLNYTRYAIYVTDLGASVGRWMCYDAAESIFARLTSFYFVQPNATDLARFAANQTTPEETDFINRLDAFLAEDAGYIAIQTTKPLALAESTTDSFIGWVAWTWNYRHRASGMYNYTYDQLLTNAMVLFIQGTYGPFRAYKT